MKAPLPDHPRRLARLASVPRLALAGCLVVAATVVPALLAPSAASAAETALNRAGWVATASTNSAAADAPANAVDSSTGTRFSSDADQAAGMWFQVDMATARTFDQITMDSGGYAGDYARGYQVEVSNDGTTFSTVSSQTGTASPETASFAQQTARYLRIVLTAGTTTNWWSIVDFNVYTSGGGGGTPPPPTGGSLGSNVYVFTPGMSQSSIQNTLNSIANQQGGNQFGTQRYALLFAPGTYGSAASPLIFSVGFYTSVAGLGRSPNDVVINGTVDVYNQCSGSTCNATTNFWRSLTNLTINVTGMTGCQSGDDFWAVSQAAPMRRVHINGNLSLMDYCNGGPGWSSGGFIADSEFTGGTVTNGSQQQFFTRNSNLDGWSNSVWNQVFCGDNGAPPQTFTSTSGDSGGTSSYTTLASCPVSEEAPYLYVDSAGNYNVFAPSLRTNSTGPTWLAGDTPGTSLPWSSFFVVQPSNTVDQINAALAAGDNLLFTPGVYSVPQPITVTRPDTRIIGLGFATLVPQNGNATMTVADVSGVNISGLIFDAGPVRSPVLLQIGTAGSTVSHAGDPVTVDDVFFRVGGAQAGSATTSFIDNSNNSIIDDLWAWRADHGAGAGSWTSDQGDTGLLVNGNNVVATGLAVEHYQKNETIWAGQGGTVIFFQNENPYEVPNQASWMASSTQDGYPAFYVPGGVTSFQGYGLGSYSYFNQGVPITNAMAFQAPNTAGVQFHDLLTVFLNGSGGINTVINGVGKAVNSGFGGPSDVVSYP